VAVDGWQWLSGSGCHKVAVDGWQWQGGSGQHSGRVAVDNSGQWQWITVDSGSG
jgi:hypothetical protein